MPQMQPAGWLFDQVEGEYPVVPPALSCTPVWCEKTRLGILCFCGEERTRWLGRFGILLQVLVLPFVTVCVRC